MVYRKLGRRSSARRALLRNLVTSLLREGHVETTEAKAREARKLADKMITLAKKGDLHSRRRAMAYLLSETVVKELFDNIAPRYQERAGGYTRILKKGHRRGDAAPVVILELVS